MYSPVAWIQVPAIRVEPVELEALALDRVLDAGLAQVVEDDRREVGPAPAASGRSAPTPAVSSSVETMRCGERLSTVNGPVTRIRFVSS